MRNGAVYIVDDDDEVRNSVAFFLTTVGCSPCKFADAAAFLAVAASLPPGCVLLDIRMPGVDGIEVLERLGQAGSTLPVVVMTGHGDVTTAVRAMKLGASDFIEKPFEEDILIAILDRVFATLSNALRGAEGKSDARARLDRLSQRERQVLIALAAGQSNKLIAYELDVSIRTVEMHRAGMMERLGVRSFAEALRLAVEGDLAEHLPPLSLRVARS